MDDLTNGSPGYTAILSVLTRIKREAEEGKDLKCGYPLSALAGVPGLELTED